MPDAHHGFLHTVHEHRYFYIHSRLTARAHAFLSDGRARYRNGRGLCVMVTSSSSIHPRNISTDEVELGEAGAVVAYLSQLDPNYTSSL